MMLIHLLVVLIIYCFNVPAEAHHHSCKKQADIVFLVDSSASINSENFTQELELVNSVVDRLSVSPYVTRVAVVSYSSDARVELDLDSHLSKNDTKAAVANISPSKGKRRNSHKAIKIAWKHLKSLSRDGAARIIVYITTGKAHSSSKALQQAEKAQRKGIQLFAVGVGNGVNITELKQLANVPSEKFVYEVPSFERTGSLDDRLVRQIYAVPEEAHDTACKRQSEVVFLVDTSSKINKKNFSAELDLVNCMVDRLDISPSATRVAVISYSKRHELLVGLDSDRPINDIKAEVANIRTTKGHHRNSHKAIRKARKHLKSLSRDGAARIIVYITTGKAHSMNKTLREANKVRRKGIQLYTVGVGNGTNTTELRLLATEPNDNFAYKAVSRKRIHHICGQLVDQISPDSSEVTATTAPPSTTASVRPETTAPTTVVPTAVPPAPTETTTPETTTYTFSPETTVPVTAIPTTTDTFFPETTVPVTAIPTTTDTFSPETTVPVTAIPTTTDTFSLETTVPVTAIPTTALPTTNIPEIIMPITTTASPEIPETMPTTVMSGTTVPTTTMPDNTENEFPEIGLPTTPEPDTGNQPSIIF